MTYQEMCEFQTLYEAYLEARKGKRSKPGTAQYEANALICTDKLSYVLNQKTYKPSGFEVFYVYEPKKRLVQAPAFVDKVVLHALTDNVLYDTICTSFVAWDAFASYGDTYALRLKYAKKVSVIIGVDVKPRRKINSTRSVRALRRVKQEQNIRRKRGDITPRKDLFQPEPRPDSIPPWM